MWIRWEWCSNGIYWFCCLEITWKNVIFCENNIVSMWVTCSQMVVWGGTSFPGLLYIWEYFRRKRHVSVTWLRKVYVRNILWGRRAAEWGFIKRWALKGLVWSPRPGTLHQFSESPASAYEMNCDKRRASYRQHGYTGFLGREHRSLPLCKDLIEMMIDIVYWPHNLVNHDSKSDLLGHASLPPPSLICPSVPGRPLLMMCNAGTLWPSLANLTTVWWSCPL